MSEKPLEQGLMLICGQWLKSFGTILEAADTIRVVALIENDAERERVFLQGMMRSQGRSFVSNVERIDWIAGYMDNNLTESGSSGQ
jgi:hypothetical protein